MVRLILAALSAAMLASFVGTSATAMPMAALVAPSASVEQVHLFCNPEVRFWWQPNYHRCYGYYRYSYDDGDDWGPRRYDYLLGYGYHRPHYWGDYWR